jgi:hypothetical protein
MYIKLLTYCINIILQNALVAAIENCFCPKNVKAHFGIITLITLLQ